MGVGRDLYARRKDNSEFPVEIGLSTLHADGNNYVLATVVDITDRKRLEERFRSTVESAPTAMVMIDRKGLIVLVNAETESMFGYKRSALLEQPVEILIPARFSSNHPAMRTGFFEKPSARAMGSARDLYARRSDGSEFPVEIGLNPVDAPDGPFVLAAIADITWRKQAENTLRSTNEELERRVAERTDQLQEANRDLEAFTYTVSHDLKAPLRGIDGYSQLLVEDYGGKLGSEGQMFVERIRRGVSQMGELIADLLNYSRMERRTMEPQALAIVQLVDKVLEDHQDEIESHGVEVRCQLEPVTLRVDREGMAVVFRNLIGNAIKFTRDRPKPLIEVGSRVDTEHCLLWVRDNGVGFDMQYHDRIFGIFQRLHRAEDYPGTGVGLALVAKAVQRMGGRVWAESRPGEGATFFMEFPR